MNIDNNSYLSQSIPKIIESNHINNPNNSNICEICYDCNESIELNCCNNTKRICNYCLNHLKSAICPWCRKELPAHLINQNKNCISRSLPDNFESYFNQERQYLLIDPDDPQYSDSRILRIALRNIRRNFNRRHNRNIESLNNRNTLTNRQRRHQVRNNLNNITRQYNNNRNNRNNINSNDQVIDDLNNLIFDLEI